jgi:general secretion pathway protein A
MYLDFYGLREVPFSLTPDTRYILKTESYLEVMANLKYGIEQCKGLVVVTGEVGSGKTTTLRSAMQQFNEEILALYIFNPFLTVIEFFEYLNAGLGLGLRQNCSKTELLNTLGHCLAQRHARGQRTVLMIDEAHGLTMSVLEEIRLLLNFETNRGKLLQIILCGQPELRGVLEQPGLRQLKQRISLRCAIKPLSTSEIQNYIRFRLKTAGAERVNLFEDDAVALIGRISQGIPRIVNNICDNALLYGYGGNRELITREVIEEVISVLELSPGDVMTRPAGAFGLTISATM